MQTSPVIQFLKNKEIDKVQWDKCINDAANGLIYAKGFYLDNIAAGWDALMGENYGWVLPLTNKRKYGITYLYQPPFTQQLGVFFKPNVTVPYNEIIQYLQQHYRFAEINWNYATPGIFTSLPLEVETATNFIVDLSAGYEDLASNYHNDLTKNLKRSKRFHQLYKATNDYNKCIRLYREYYSKRMPHVKENDYKNFSQACSFAFANDLIICREVVDDHQTLMAVALLLFDGKRLYNLMNTTSDAGRKTGANHFLLAGIIKEFCGRQILLDFEGSDLPGVKTFYENFGAVNQPYFRIRYNRLPWPLKIFKG